MATLQELLQYNFRELIQYQIMGMVYKKGDGPFGDIEKLEEKKPNENATPFEKAMYNLTFRLQQAWEHGEFAEKNKKAPKEAKQVTLSSRQTVVAKATPVLTSVDEHRSLEEQIENLSFETLCNHFINKQRELVTTLGNLEGEEAERWLRAEINQQHVKDLFLMIETINKKRSMPMPWKIGEALLVLALAAGITVGFGPGVLGAAFFHWVASMAPAILSVSPIAPAVIPLIPNTLLTFAGIIGADKLINRFVMPSETKHVGNALNETLEQRKLVRSR